MTTFLDFIRKIAAEKNVTKHYGPGPHKGTGTSQKIHGGARQRKGTPRATEQKKKGRQRKTKRTPVTIKKPKGYQGPKTKEEWMKKWGKRKDVIKKPEAALEAARAKADVLYFFPKDVLQRAALEVALKDEPDTFIRLMDAARIK